MVTKTRKGLIEIRWHGRGGQGAVTSAELLARAAINDGEYAQAFPTFGPERRGAPVMAFDRIDSDNQIRVRAEIREPDVVVVLDPTLMKVVNVLSGLKEGGWVVVNSKKNIETVGKEYGIEGKLAIVDATSIAKDVLGVNIVNTTMLGALLRATPVVEMESMMEPLEERFGRLASRNFDAMKKAYETTVVKE